MVYASPGRRLLGFIIDLFVLAAVSALALPFFDVTLEQLRTGDLPPGWQLLYTVLFGVYQVGFVAWRGQTPGKIALRIKVVDDTRGQVPSLGYAAIRWVIVAAASSLPGLGLIATAVVYGWLLVNPRRQGVHDIAARTVVIDLLLPTAPPPDPPRRDEDGEEGEAANGGAG